MYCLYSACLTLLAILTLPYWLYRAVALRNYRGGLAERLGFLPAALRPDGRRTVWIHSVSVGETLAAQPIAFYLREQFPDVRIVLTTMTRTGQAIGKQRFAAYNGVFYFPLDLGWVANRALAHVRPDVVVVVETEIWPNFLRVCARRGIPVVMANGRISRRSFGRYRTIRGFLARVFRHYTQMIMKAEEDADLVVALGAPADRVVVEGNVKYDRDYVERALVRTIAADLDQQLGLSGCGPLIVAGSTHSPEEEILLEGLGRIRRQPGLEGTRMLLAPRHPERFGAIAQAIERAGFRVLRRSAAGSTDPACADVVLLDTLGELAAAYKFATVAFVGGTFSTRGGQSILEPALFGRPTVVGPHMENFPQVIKDFTQAEAVLQLPYTDPAAFTGALTAVLIEALRGSPSYVAMGERAQAVLDRNRGAAWRTVQRIVRVLEKDRRTDGLPRGGRNHPRRPGELSPSQAAGEGEPGGGW